MAAMASAIAASRSLTCRAVQVMTMTMGSSVPEWRMTWVIPLHCCSLTVGSAGKLPGTRSAAPPGTPERLNTFEQAYFLPNYKGQFPGRCATGSWLARD